MEINFNFKFVIGDMELRSCDQRLLSTNTTEHNTAEIVKRNEGHDSCYSVAYWVVGRDTADLKFVGNRPFDQSVDMESFWALAQIGQQTLELLIEKKC